MAVTVIGGLAATLVVAVFVLPFAYMRLGSPEDAGVWGEELFDLSLTELEDEMPLTEEA